MPCRLVILGLVCSLLVALPVGAGQPPFADPWRWSHFTVADGLPSDVVAAAVDVPGDSLWVVTRRGLARFDGYRWQPVRLQGASNDPEITLVPAGNAEVLALSSGLLFAGRGGVLRRVPEPAGRPVHSFVGGARARTGPALLLTSDGQLYEWNAGAIRRHDVRLALGRLRAIRQAGTGMVWVSGDRGLACWDGVRWRLRLPARGGVPYSVLGLWEADDESAWAYVERPAEARGLWHWQADGRSVRRITSPIASLAMTTRGELLAVHLTGDLTVLRDRAFAALQVGAATPVVDVRSLGTLSNGDVAVATDHGLFLYRESEARWAVHALPAPDDANSINEIARGPDGRLWMGTSRGLAELLPGGGLHVTERADGERLSSVTGLAFDRRGRMWIGSGSGFRGVRWRDAGGWHRLTTDSRLDTSYIHRITLDRQGGLWFLGLSDNADRSGDLPLQGPGAFRLGPDGRLTTWGQAEGLPSGRVYAVEEGPDGAYWFGTLIGLSRWRQGQWRHWTMADGLRSPRVFTLAVDQQNQVWFGHQTAGLGCLRDDRVVYVTPQGRLDGESVWSVRRDERNRLWVVTEGAVSVLDQGRWLSFDAGSGLPNTRVWPVWPEADRVYLGTTGAGLIELALSAPSPPPVVSVDRPVVESDGVIARWRAFSWWGEVAPEAIPTRAQLDDLEWTPWTTRRDAGWAGLAPGEHRVRVQAKGLLGTPGPVSEPVVVTIEPPLFLRPIVYLPITGLALVVAGLLTLLAIRQRQHHLAVHEREALFAKVFHASPLPTAITRMDDAVWQDVNTAFERLTGRGRDELVGRSAMEVGVTASDFPGAEVSRTLQAEGSVRGLPVTLTRSGGEAVEALAYFEMIELAGRKSVLSQVIDVSEQRRLESQLQHAQKMESVGRLAGGVAHDFNNLLTVILGNASLIDAAMTSGDPRRGELEQIRAAAERAERLTRQLLTFARKQVVEPRVVNVNEIVLRTDRMLRRLIGEDIELVTITPDVWPVLIDPGQLEQVLVNMAVNARDAMPAGGKLTIRTSNVVIDDKQPGRDPEAVPGPYVRLSISDSGTGMDSATAARVFDPFFTTKEAGKGTGLGLAMCYGVVKQAGGQVTVATAPGQGTTFHVDLPRAAEVVWPADARERAVETPGGRERILLVEDEVQVRRLAATVLRQRGYEVLEAAGGPEALQVAGHFPGQIDVLLTDVVMPQMRGTEVARSLRGMRPGIKVLYMSGYTDDDCFRQEAGADGAFLAKPFTPATLAGRVRQLLDGNDGD